MKVEGILYRGPSRIDGKPIVAIATDGSRNKKTGREIQIWILRSDVEPHIAVKTGQDESVCGTCSLRPSRKGGCYVQTFNAPLSVYRRFKRGGYGRVRMDEFKGRTVRFGAYGDPAALPPLILGAVMRSAQSWTGYTHQWGRFASKELRAACMASVDPCSPSKETAWAKGFRTFSVASSGGDSEIECPNTTHGVTCEACRLCKGNSIAAKNIFIKPHGYGTNALLRAEKGA